MLFAACGDNSDDPALPEAPATAKVTIARTGESTGKITASLLPLSCGDQCTATVRVGSLVHLKAKPDVGATFGGWTGTTCAPTATTCTVEVTQDMTIGAQFDVAIFEVDLGLLGNGGGTVISTPAGMSCPGPCSLSVPYNTTVELVASADASSTFMGWGGECDGMATCSFVVTADTSVMAAFAANQDLIVMPAGNGAGTVTSTPAGISCGTTCAHGYAPDTVVTLSATPDAGSFFTGWSGACSGTGTCEVTMTSATMVTATFTLAQHALAVELDGTGTGSVASNPAGIACGTDCTKSFDLGTSVTLTATADAGSAFVGWSGACTGKDTCTVTMSADTQVSATFDVIGTLASINDGTGQLTMIDPGSLAVSDIGALGVAYSFGDCTYHVGDSKLYMTDGRGAKALYTVDVSTGAATLIGAHGIDDMFALGYHPPTDKLYGIGGNGNLYTLDAATGAATLVGPTGDTSFNGLVWDSTRSMFVGLTAGATALYSIDVATGAKTLLASTTFLDNNGLTYDAISDLFWSIDYAGTVVTFDPNNGYARADVGTVSGARTCVAYLPPVN